MEDLRVKRFTRLYSNPKVKAKLFKDSKTTVKKRPKSSSVDRKNKTNLFPGVILPFKKKSTAKKLFVKREPREENYNLKEENCVIKTNNLDFSKPSFTKKSNWTEYIKQEKPNRIKIEQSDKRKFFKSTVIHSDTPNK